MPADPETLAAIQAVADRIDAKLDAHQEKSDESNRRVHQRVDDHARESREAIERTSLATSTALGALATQLASVVSELHSHTKHDDDVQQRHEAAINALRKEGGETWKTLAKMGASGGIGAAIAKWLEGGHGP